MHTLASVNTVSRLLPVFSLILLTSLTSGCATRALMSSDRYDKPEQQFHSSEIDIQALEQAYQLALQEQASATH